MNVGRAITNAMQSQARYDLRFRIYPQAQRRGIGILNWPTFLAITVGWDSGPHGPSGRWWH